MKLVIAWNCWVELVVAFILRIQHALPSVHPWLFPPLNMQDAVKRTSWPINPFPVHCSTLLVPLLPSQCHCPSSHALRGPTIDPHHHYDKHSTCPMGQQKFFPEPLWSSPMPDWLSDDVTFSLIHHWIDFNCRSFSRPNWIVTLSSPNWIVTAPVGRVSHPCSSCLLSKGTSLNLQK